MALNIKNPEAERLAAEVAGLAGESKTEAIRVALSERKEKLLLSRGAASKRERIEADRSEFTRLEGELERLQAEIQAMSPAAG